MRRSFIAEEKLAWKLDEMLERKAFQNQDETVNLLKLVGFRSFVSYFGQSQKQLPDAIQLFHFPFFMI